MSRAVHREPRSRARGGDRSRRVEHELRPRRRREIVGGARCDGRPGEQIAEAPAVGGRGCGEGGCSALHDSSRRGPVCGKIHHDGHELLRRNVRCEPLDVFDAVLHDSDAAVDVDERANPLCRRCRVIGLGRDEHPVHRSAVRRAVDHGRGGTEKGLAGADLESGERRARGDADGSRMPQLEVHGEGTADGTRADDGDRCHTTIIADAAQPLIRIAAPTGICSSVLLIRSQNAWRRARRSVRRRSRSSRMESSNSRRAASVLRRLLIWLPSLRWDAPNGRPHPGRRAARAEIDTRG